jgi:hypothetical protein
MGGEAETTMRLGQRPKMAGKVLLETDYLLFRGDERLKIPFSDVKGVEAKDGLLLVTFSKGQAAFDLGAKKATAWAQKIAKPKGRAEKLGLKPGALAAIVGAFDEDFRAEVAPFLTEKGKPEHLFFAAESKKDLSRVPGLAKRAAGVWIVYPKGRKDIREADVLEAGRAAGLKDVKVARFSDTHTALRFVHPKAKG